jgi:CDP-diacylglycerol pyrophosphatase
MRRYPADEREGRKPSRQGFPAALRPGAAGRLCAALALALLLVQASALAADPNALWKIVHDRCVPGVERGAGPAPCSLADPAAGYAILKDLRGATQFLLIPTARIAGIESPAILAPGAPDYWQQAWAARRFVDKAAGRELPRIDVGLAINAEMRRSQNQLHIHIDCIRVDVKQKLAEAALEPGPGWSAIALPPSANVYLARTIESSDLAGVYPFRLLAARLASPTEMGEQTLVVVGAKLPSGKDGFYLLNDQAAPGLPSLGWGEELLDHDCALLKQEP